MRFLTNTIDGIKQLIKSTDIFTGNSSEIVVTNNDGLVDSSLLPPNGNSGGNGNNKNLRFEDLVNSNIDNIQFADVLVSLQAGTITNVPFYAIYIPFSWTWFAAINNGNITNGFLRRQNGTQTDRAPYIAGYNCRIECITMTNQPTEQDDWNLEVYVNGELRATFLKPQNTNKIRFAQAEINITLNELDAVSLRCARNGNSGNISYPGCSLYVREIFNI